MKTNNFYCGNCYAYHQDKADYSQVFFTKEFGYLIIIMLILIGIGILAGDLIQWVKKFLWLLKNEYLHWFYIEVLLVASLNNLNNHSNNIYFYRYDSSIDHSPEMDIGIKFCFYFDYDIFLLFV